MNNIVNTRFSQIFPRWLISFCYELRYSSGKLLFEIDENPISKTVGSFHNFFILFYDYKFATLQNDSTKTEEILQKCQYFDVPENITNQIQVTKDEFYDINLREISIGDMYIINPLHATNDEDVKVGSTLLLFHSDYNGTSQIAKDIDVDNQFEENDETPEDSKYIKGIKVARVINLLGIENLQEISNDTKSQIHIKDCGSQNKGNFFRLQGLFSAGISFYFLLKNSSIDEFPVILSQYHNDKFELSKGN